MRDWLRSLFAFEEGLAGPVNLARPKNAGSMRPGRRSTELELEAKKRAKLQQTSSGKLPPGLTQDLRVFQRQAPVPPTLFSDPRTQQRQTKPPPSLLADRRVQQLARPAPKSITRPVVDRSTQRKASPVGKIVRTLSPGMVAALRSGNAKALTTELRGPPGQEEIDSIFGQNLPGADEEESGGDDTGGSVGNGFVWVAGAEAPMLVRQLLGFGDRPEPPLRWPDGTDWMAQYWLPALDLSSTFNPVDWINRLMLRVAPDVGRVFGQSYWPPADRWLGREGWHHRPDGSWDWIIDGWCPDKYYGNAPRVSGVGPLKGTDSIDRNWLASLGMYATERTGDRCGDWPSENWIRLQHFLASFDWSTQPPDRQAYIWIWLNLLTNPVTGWIRRPADLYAYGSTQGLTLNPSTLPPPAWLDLNFLDAINTGAHGMPVLTKDQGGRRVLDPSKLATLANDMVKATGDYRWRIAVEGLEQEACLATIYDNAPRAPEILPPFVPPAPPPGSTPPSPDEPPVEDEVIVEEEPIVDEEPPPDETPPPDVVPPWWLDERSRDRDYYPDGNYAEAAPDESGGDALSMLQELLYVAGPGVVAEICLQLIGDGLLTVDDVIEVCAVLDGGDAVLDELIAMVAGEEVLEEPVDEVPADEGPADEEWWRW